MKINVLFSPANADELFFTGKTAVVIDVLRASTTIINALQNGAKELIPVSTVEFAMKASSSMFGGQTLLGGERNTKKIEGFNLGNSPLEYSEESVKGKSVILYTTNGTRAIVKAKFSANLVVCAFNNLNAIAAYLIEKNSDVEILCAGKNNLFCIEDVVCAGKLTSELVKMKEDILLTDAAKASVALGKTFGKSIPKMLAECEHGQLLISNGFADDIKICSKLNITDIIPAFQTNIIKILDTKPKLSEEQENALTA